MQECFVRLILSVPERTANLRAWLYRVARNLLIDEIRSRRSETALSEQEETLSPDDDPLLAYLQSEERRLLLLRITELDRKKREVLILQYYCGLSQKEIAELLQVSHENVRVLSLRARRELKTKLKEDGYDFS